MKIPSELKNAAIAAFKAGRRWPEFAREHRDAIRSAAPYNSRKFHRLRDAVRSIVVSGTTDGLYPPNDPDACPWEQDDAPRQTMLFDCEPSAERMAIVAELAEAIDGVTVAADMPPHGGVMGPS